ncbi:hypothetical protein ACFQL1_18425 [Halomicroarcula sp. GCM10025709]|uniref:hypothetical protein n=1 Tax=Halomicroarcula sp. GCM10025709 TaxID=3252669 RepID=UPI003610511D
MEFVGDERSQSIQVGAVLLFAVLIIAFSTYQAFVVPDQNRQIEFNHNQEVQQQLQDLRNAIVSMPGEGVPGDECGTGNPVPEPRSRDQPRTTLRLASDGRDHRPECQHHHRERHRVR